MGLAHKYGGPNRVEVGMNRSHFRPMDVQMSVSKVDPMNRAKTFALVELLLELGELHAWEREFLYHLLERHECNQRVKCGHRATLLALIDKYKRFLDGDEVDEYL